MAHNKRSPQYIIAQMMNEDYDFTASSAGVSVGQDMPSLDVGCDDCDNGLRSTNDNYEDDEPTSSELKLGKRFVELIGSIEKARTILDKIEECSDCLDLIDDEDENDVDSLMINKIAEIMPSDVDGVTSPTAAHNLASLYNPSNIR